MLTMARNPVALESESVNPGNRLFIYNDLVSQRPTDSTTPFLLKGFVHQCFVSILENLFGSAFCKNSQSQEGKLLVARRGPPCGNPVCPWRVSVFKQNLHFRLNLKWY